MLSLDEAEEILKRGTFRLCLGKHRDETGLLTDFYGTGFFVGLKGEALTANHNFEDCSPDGTFEAVYKGHQIFLKWIREKSSEVSDIAFMRLHAVYTMWQAWWPNGWRIGTRVVITCEALAAIPKGRPLVSTVWCVGAHGISPKALFVPHAVMHLSHPAAMAAWGFGAPKTLRRSLSSWEGMLNRCPKAGLLMDPSEGSSRQTSHFWAGEDFCMEWHPHHID